MPCHLSYRLHKEKGNSMKKKLTLIVCLLLFFVMAMGSGSKQDANTGTASDNGETKEPVTVGEEVIFDEKDIKITVKGLENDGWLGPKLKLLIENNSAQNICVQTRLSSVNGFMIYSSISEDVAASKKANSDITFEESYLKQAKIDTISSMQFSFHIFDSDTWNGILDSEPITVYTSAKNFVQPLNDEGLTLIDEKGIKIISKGLDSDSSIFGPELILYIENNTGINTTVQARDVSINGFMADSIMSCDISKDNKAVTSLTFMTSDLEENGIEEIKDIELSFHVYDYDSYKAYFDTQTVKVEF